MPKKRIIKTKTSRNNPNTKGSKAEKDFKTFHGYPSEKITEFEEVENYEDDVAKFGDLIEMEILNPESDKLLTLTFKGTNINLAGGEEGKQLYFIGGDQSLPLEDIRFLSKEERSKDLVEIGRIWSITYGASKSHLGGSKDYSEWAHEFGEEDEKKGKEKRLPLLLYMRRSKKMRLIGGGYWVKKEGIYN